MAASYWVGAAYLDGRSFQLSLKEGVIKAAKWPLLPYYVAIRKIK